MRARATAVAAGLIASLVIGGGCEKTKTDMGVDLMREMIDLWVDSFEDYFSLVKSNVDLCSKCVRDTQAFVDQREGQMRALLGKWNQLKASSTTKESRDAVEAVRPRVQDAMVKIGKQQEEGYEIFEKHSQHCSDTIHKVYKNMQRMMSMFERLVGHEF